MSYHGTRVGGLLIGAALLGSPACESPSRDDTRNVGGGTTVLEDQKTVSLSFNPASFVGSVTNPYFPLSPGTSFHYRSETPDGVEIDDVTVTHDSRQIMGVSVTVVHDQVSLEGDLTEDTFDWYAQDGDGNIWYFGEDSKEIENGQVVSTEGSWQAGVGDNQPGVFMLADPKVGLAYHQEDAPDVAEDMARVLSLKAAPDVPYGSFEDCLGTMEWSLIEHGAREHKSYCPGIGMVLEDQPQGGHIRNELVSISHF